MTASGIHWLKQIFRRFRKQPTIRVDFNDGPCVEIISAANPHRVTMSDDKMLIHETTIEGRQWTRANQRYFTHWHLTVYQLNNRKVFEHQFNLNGKIVRVNIDSKSLGDTLAWIPQIALFAQTHPNCRVYVSQFWTGLFDTSKYAELHFIDPQSVVENCYATYFIGYYFENSHFYHPNDPKALPLGKVAADILNIPYRERRPFVCSTKNTIARPRSRYVCIATTSTAECKHWLYPNGWQMIIDYLKNCGLETMVIQKEETTLCRVENQSGDQHIGSRIEQLQGCEFFIGLGSGLSWLAWSVGKPVVLISGFSQPYAEFTYRCERVINSEVCHGCWNDTNHCFDRDDWNWCPKHKGTDRQFECSLSITPAMVIQSINNILNEN